jgi:glycosyltransferase involved in cell wall biosynthesis
MDKISVVIPSYNGEAFIAEALQSVFHQTRPVDEIIVVDDGSSDGTIEILKKYADKITLIENSHKGNPAFGRNIGIEKATGNFIAFLDQDDLWPENKLEIQIANLQQKTDAMVDFGKVKLLNQQNLKDQTHLAQFFNEKHDYFLLSGGLFRKEAFGLVGKFDETLTFHSSDFDWIARAIEKGIFFSKNETITFIYRIHSGNYSNNFEKIKRGVAEVFMKSILRRKQISQGGFATFPKMKII